MRFPNLVLLSACALMFVLTLVAQSPNGVIDGLVVDPSNRAIIGADVVVANDVTGLRYTAQTNDEGIYVLSNLPPGPYRLQVSKVGFKAIIKPDVVLSVQDALAINFTLPVGAFSETITVEGGAPLVNTESAAVSTVVDNTLVENLPLNGRSFNTLMQLTPGVVTAPATVASPGQFSVSGQRTDANSFSVDGMSVNFGVAATYQSSQSGTGSSQAFSVLGGTSSLVSVEALQEFRIETSSFAPEFGRSPGGQVIVTTRSGTNVLHGNLYEYFRNDVLDANDWFANAAGIPRASERHNDFGGTLGGPIFKDKTFFFFSYEGARLRLPGTQVEEVPSMYARQIAPTAVAPFLNAYPNPSDRTVVSGVYLSPFTGAFSNRATLNAGSVRVDHTFNKKFSIFARYNKAPSQTVNRVHSLSELESVDVDTQTMTGGVNLTNGRSSNTLRGNYSSQTSSSSSTLDSFGGAAPPSSSTFFGTLPPKNDLAYFFPTGLAYYSLGPIAKNQSRQANIADALSVSIGTHLLKFGADYRAIYLDVTPPNYTVQIVPSSAESFIASGTVFLASLLELPAPIVSRAFSLYGQDTWKLGSRITLTYGLRWEVDPAPSGRGKTQLASWKNVTSPANLTLAPPGTPLWSTVYRNFAPRVGVAYRITSRNDFVLRAGWGIYYDLGVGSSANTAAQYPNSNISFHSAVPVPFSNIAQYLPGTPTSAPPYPSLIYAFAPDLGLPRSYQWNVALEKSFQNRQAISATYVGQAGRGLLRQEALYQPNPNFAGEFFLTQNQALSNYNALQIQYRRPLSSHLQVLANYTWAHALDDASDDVGVFLPSGVLNLSASKDYASSSFDVRHSFSGAFVYELPSTSRLRPVSIVTNHWSISSVIVARSGFPFNAALLFESADPRGYATTRPDQVPGQTLWVKQSSVPGGRSLNAAAFMVPTPVRQGTEPRNNIAGFGLTQVDLSLVRKFPVTERINVQFRADAFNALNHPNFTNPDGYIELGQFGLQSSQMSNQGLGGLNPLFQSGGPRSLQLSLRLAF